MNKFTLSIASILIAALPAQASAEPSSPARSIIVPFGDLNLRTPAGRSDLQDRLNAAVRRVCSTGFAGGVETMFERHRCIRQTGAAVRNQARVAIARAYQGEARDAVLAAR